MVSTGRFLLLFHALAAGFFAGVSSRDDAPQVYIDHATIVGKTNGTVDSFLGIPYAQPP